MNTITLVPSEGHSVNMKLKKGGAKKICKDEEKGDSSMRKRRR